ncbi:two component transcriptional regulator, LuxR family [Xylanimonas cellulosilytica DSM 15894]|uniref:Two component transcriptional regulator, LuxR family n=1 Tax=Xylanimonas cellulosilytica (strain DSM 15894 / JCM 12276 / CECT 5975 / KCTC 9989 / LMG 20990 / NBRC 107835 / XIL07) TaxID=446471 RepID=D1BSF0_XYLCX|nr:response regulator transcription factor [Xylanimonas cellulosilytica]ACZ30642.1 two component transcriptional regulator, LuxR family [Xylanimonas cellulosilytica DSM 15894]
MIRVLVVDDQTLIRSAVVGLLGAADDVEVVAEAGDGRRAVELARRHRPDVVLMDIRMPVMDGIDATRTICADRGLEAVRVLVLTTFEEDAFIVGALRAGASGFLGKGSEPGEIIAAIRAVHGGEALLSPTATRALIDRYVRPSPSDVVPQALEHLTEREVEILTLVGSGLSNAEIADRLVISPHTAKTHVNRVMTKLHAHDRAQLVIAAYENGLVRPQGA